MDFLLRFLINKQYNEQELSIYYLQDPPPLPTKEVGQFKARVFVNGKHL
jgi:hypothetical protein